MGITEREIRKFRSVAARAIRTTAQCLVLRRVTLFEEGVYLVQASYKGKFPYCFLIRLEGFAVLKFWRESGGYERESV